jgi:ribosomal protein L29
MTPRSSRPLVDALRRLSADGIRARLYAEGFRQTSLRVEATTTGPASPERAEEVRRTIRRAVADPDMRGAVRFCPVEERSP